MATAKRKRYGNRTTSASFLQPIFPTNGKAVLLPVLRSENKLVAFSRAVVQHETRFFFLLFLLRVFFVFSHLFPFFEPGLNWTCDIFVRIRIKPIRHGQKKYPIFSMVKVAKGFFRGRWMPDDPSPGIPIM